MSALCWLGLMMTWVTQRHGAHRAAAGAGAAWAPLGSWMLMVGAMMLPVLTPQARQIALRGLWHRRHQAVAAFAAGYLAVWTIVGVALIGFFQVTGVRGPGAAVVCLLAAAAWHCTAPRRAAVRQCGRFRTLALTGFRAHLDCLAAGALAGCSAVWTCGPAMTAMCLSHGPVLAIGVGGVLLAEHRSGPNPEQRIGSAAQAGWLVMLAGLAGLGG